MVLIEADLPFEFCKYCLKRELVSSCHYDGLGNSYMNKLYCQNADLCKTAIELRDKYENINEA